jgi:predicted nucleic acid-binding protein
MIVVVDSNIAFSAILNTQSLIGDLILNSQGIFKFRTCNFLTKEINLHWKKILKVSKLAEEELQESRRLIYKNIDFIDERQIPLSFRNRGYELTKEIDKKDFVFISLNEFNESLLWTGDKQLINGLRANGYQKVISTDELEKL